jgi:hypothetical protein
MNTADLVSKNMARFQELHERQLRLRSYSDRYNDLFFWINETQRMAKTLEKPEPVEDPLYVKAVMEFNNLHQEFLDGCNEHPEYVELHNWLNMTKRVFPEEFGEIIALSTILQRLSPHAEIRSDLIENRPPIEQVESTNTLQQFGEAFGMGLLAMAQIKEGMSIPFRRQLNNQALEKVENLLLMHGTLHFDRIVRLMKDAGWKGYPIEESNGTIDAKALYNAMQFRAREGDRFKNNGENKWSLIAQDGKE